MILTDDRGKQTVYRAYFTQTMQLRKRSKGGRKTPQNF